MTATETPAQTGTATPASLKDGLLDLIDQAHAEDVTPLADSAATVSTPSLEKPTTPEKESKAAPVKSGEKPDPKAEAKADPKKEKADEDIAKKYEEQRAANRRMGTEVKAAQAKIAQLEAKLNGTYQEPQEPSADEKDRLAEFRGREAASRKMAIERYGEDTVMSQIYADESPYQKLITAEPWLHARTARADQPVEEALRILRERRVYDELGHDPDKWEQAISDKLRPIILAELKQQASSDKALLGKEVPGVGTVRGASDERKSALEDEDFSLSSIGSHFLD